MLTGNFSVAGSSRCRGEDDITAVKERWMRRYLEQRNSGWRVTEQPPATSCDDWEAIVRHNERILEQRNFTAAVDRLRPRVEKLERVRTAGWNGTEIRQSADPLRGVKRPRFKPSIPPKPTQRAAPKYLLPVQQFLKRQVHS